MTTVLAIQYADGVMMSGDTLSTDSSSRPWYSQKIRDLGHYLVGGAGDSRPCDIILHTWKPPTPTAKDHEDLLRFMVVKAIPSLQKTIEASHYSKSDGGDGWAFLIAVGGKVFIVEDDYSVAEPLHDVAAIGSGSWYAIGAARGGASIEKAMEIATENDYATGSPFTYLEQKKRR